MPNSKTKLCQTTEIGWTKAHSYGGGLLPPQALIFDNSADGLKPIRTVGVYSHRQRSLLTKLWMD